MKKHIVFLLTVCTILVGFSSVSIVMDAGAPVETCQALRTAGDRDMIHVGPGQTYSTIATAIGQARSGDTIRVHADTYTENVVVPVDKSLCFEGDGPGLSVIDGCMSGDVISILSDSTTIRGFTVKNSGTEPGNAGIYLRTDGTIIEDCNVTHNTNGLYLNCSSNNTIRNCTVFDNSENGISVPGYYFTYMYDYDFETGLDSRWSTYKSNTHYGKCERTTWYDTPHSGRYHFMMATNTNKRTEWSLNELVYHGTGHEIRELTFWEKRTSDLTHSLPSTWTGHYNGDGVAVSTDNSHWTKIWQGPGSSSYSRYTFDLTGYDLGTDWYIKFQEYGRFWHPANGMFWDDIHLELDDYVGLDYDNNISDCTVFGNDGNGMLIEGGVRNDVCGCTAYENGEHGICLENARFNSVTGCTMHDNEGSGLEIISSNDNVVTDCHSHHNGISGIVLAEKSRWGLESPLPNSWSTYSSNSEAGRNEISEVGTPHRGDRHWQMDIDSGTSYNLNELVYHHTDGPAGTLSFYVKNTGENPHSLPVQWNGHRSGDGVAVSTDNNKWKRVWQGPGTGTYEKETVDLEEYRLGSDFYVKFQQYDNGPTPEAGMFWDDVELGTANDRNVLTGCMICDNTEVGIVVGGDNNIVRENTVMRHPSYGVRVSGSSNLLYHNNFIGNNPGGRQGVDTGELNRWHHDGEGHGGEGNHWSDHTGPDADHDGIVDSPYVLDGNYSDGDSHALTRPYGSPVISTANTETIEEDEPYRVTYDAIDINSPRGSLVWSMDTNATWLGFNTTNRLLKGTPRNEHVGVYYVNVTVRDSLFRDWNRFELAVMNVNDDPEIRTANVKWCYEDDPYSVDYEAEDVDPTNDKLTWNLDEGPSFLTLDAGTGLLSGIPGNDDVGEWDVGISVSDGKGGADISLFSLTIENRNDDPVWTDVPGNASLMEGESYSFDVNAEDVDAGDVLSYYISSDPASSITIDEDTGSIEWSPDPFGEYRINVSVCDSWVCIYHEYTVTVTSSNSRPFSVLISPQNSSEIDVTNPVFRWSGTDADGEGDNLTYGFYLSKNRADITEPDPDSLVAEALGSASCAPAKELEKGATYYWTVIPFDGKDHGECTSGIWSFMVKETAVSNRAPALAAMDDATVTEGALFTVVITATDEDGDHLTYGIASGPLNATIGDDGIITWQTAAGDAGVHDIIVTVRDGTEQSTGTFRITVLPGGGSGGNGGKTGGTGDEGENTSRSGLLIAGIIGIIVVLVIVFVVVIAVIIAVKKGKTDDGTQRDDGEGIPGITAGSPVSGVASPTAGTGFGYGMQQAPVISPSPVVADGYSHQYAPGGYSHRYAPGGSSEVHYPAQEYIPPSGDRYEMNDILSGDHLEQNAAQTDHYAGEEISIPTDQILPYDDISMSVPLLPGMKNGFAAAGEALQEEYTDVDVDFMVPYGDVPVSVPLLPGMENGIAAAGEALPEYYADTVSHEPGFETDPSEKLVIESDPDDDEAAEKETGSSDQDDFWGNLRDEI